MQLENDTHNGWLKWRFQLPRKHLRPVDVPKEWMTLKQECNNSC